MTRGETAMHMAALAVLVALAACRVEREEPEHCTNNDGDAYCAEKFPDGSLTVFDDIGHWNTGDPLTDIDGDPRPTVDGTADFAGADVP